MIENTSARSGGTASFVLFLPLARADGVLGENQISTVALPSSSGTGVGLPPWAPAVRSTLPCCAVAPGLAVGLPAAAFSESPEAFYAAANFGDPAMTLLFGFAHGG